MAAPGVGPARDGAGGEPPRHTREEAPAMGNSRTQGSLSTGESPTGQPDETAPGATLPNSAVFV